MVVCAVNNANMQLIKSLSGTHCDHDGYAMQLN